MAFTVTQYLMKRISELGVKEIFGVPGDYNFHILEAVEENENTRWIGCCNELNAGYAADGYARINGIGALVTTFGVGELSAINAVAGSFAESVPVIKIVGMPKKSVIDAERIIHHSLGNTNYEVFHEMYSKVTGYSVVLSKENAQQEIEEALSVAYNQKKPVYIGIYGDLCREPINITMGDFTTSKSDEASLDAAISHILRILDEAKDPVVISDRLILRYKLQGQMEEFIGKSGFKVTTFAMGKSSVDETSANYLGLYCGHILSEENSKIVEDSDCILGFGLLMSNFNTGGYTSNLDFDKVIDIQSDYVKIKGAIYQNVLISDVLNELNKKITKKQFNIPKIKFGYDTKDATNDTLTQNYIYSALQEFLQEDDILVAETGLSSFSSALMKLPKNMTYCNQILWGSIGWATPACFGAAMAAPTRRVIMVTGEGSHQMTAQEVSSMLRYKTNPILIVINNNGYTVERLLCDNSMDEYNEIAKWDYSKFPEVFDGKSLTIKARTEKEFYDALKSARKSDTLVYIEAFTGMMDATDFLLKLTAKVAPH